MPTSPTLLHVFLCSKRARLSADSRASPETIAGEQAAACKLFVALANHVERRLAAKTEGRLIEPVCQLFVAWAGLR